MYFYLVTGILLTLFLVWTGTSKREHMLLFALLGVLTAVSAAVVFESLTFEGLDADPGAGFMPSLWAGCLLLLCPLQILFTLRSDSPKGVEITGGTGKLLALFGFMGAYLWVSELLGYYISTLLFLILCTTFLGNKRHFAGVSLSIGWLVFVYLVFVQVLQIPLPQGELTGV